MAALLQHMMTSPPGGAAAGRAEAGSQEALRSPGVHDEWAAFAADHELFSQHEVDQLRQQFLDDMLEDQRCVRISSALQRAGSCVLMRHRHHRDAQAIMFSQMLLPEPSDSDDEPLPEEDASDEEDTPEKPKPKRTRRVASSQQQAADRLLMPPPAPRPARGKAGRASSADGAPAHASHEPQDAVERPPAAPPRVLRWNRPAPSTAALRQDLVQHGLPEVRFLRLFCRCCADAFIMLRSTFRMRTVASSAALRAPSRRRCRSSAPRNASAAGSAAWRPGAPQTRPGRRPGLTAPRALRRGRRARTS